MNNKILLVDDEVFFLTVLSEILIDEPYEIHTAASGEQAQEIMRNHCFKVVISDECMNGMQGSEFLSCVRERHPNTVRILLTGHATLKAAMKAVNQGEIYRFFTKSCNDTEIKFAVRSAIEKFDLEYENRRLLSTLNRQSLEIKVLEQRFPGITRVEKDEQGNFVLNDMPETEVWRMMEMCERENEEERDSQGRH
jgi:two-component system probable response regulator PhcQ